MKYEMKMKVSGYRTIIVHTDDLGTATRHALSEMNDLLEAGEIGLKIECEEHTLRD